MSHTASICQRLRARERTRLGCEDSDRARWRGGVRRSSGDLRPQGPRCEARGRDACYEPWSGAWLRAGLWDLAPLAPEARILRWELICPHFAAAIRGKGRCLAGSYCKQGEEIWGKGCDREFQTRRVWFLGLNAEDEGG